MTSQEPTARTRAASKRQTAKASPSPIDEASEPDSIGNSLPDTEPESEVSQASITISRSQTVADAARTVTTAARAVAGAAQTVTSAVHAQTLAEKDELIRQLRQQLREKEERDAYAARDAEIVRLTKAVNAPVPLVLGTHRTADVHSKSRSDWDADIHMRDAGDDSDDDSYALRNSLHPRTAKYPLPDKFKGTDLKEASRFIEQWEDIHGLDPGGYPTEYHKVVSAALQLTGEPRERWSGAERKKFRHNPRYSFTDFEAFIYACVSDPINRGFVTGAAYEKAAQRKGQTVNAFAIELATMEAQLRAGYTDAQSAQHLLNKLRPSLRENIMLHAPKFQTREELIELATRFEQVAKERADRFIDRSARDSSKNPRPD